MCNAVGFSQTLAHNSTARGGLREHARTQLTQILDLLGEDRSRNVYARELEIRPAGAPTIRAEASPEDCLASGDASQLRRV